MPSDIIDIDNLSEPSEPSVSLHYECERTVTLAFLWGLKLIIFDPFCIHVLCWIHFPERIVSQWLIAGQLVENSLL